MNSKNLKVLILVASLVMSSLACNLLSATTAKTRVVPTIAPADAQQLQDQLATQVSQAMGGEPVTIEFTESQITSLVNNQTANIQEAQLSNVQVLLENNQMVISGDANANGISGKMNIVLDVATDATGKPKMTISKAVLGGFPIPSNMLETLSQLINQSMQSQGGEGFEVLSLTIADHKMILTGQKN